MGNKLKTKDNKNYKSLSLRLQQNHWSKNVRSFALQSVLKTFQILNKQSDAFPGWSKLAFTPLSIMVCYDTWFITLRWCVQSHWFSNLWGGDFLFVGSFL